ncbi:uncharacterized protein LOC121383052 [Gigantopelta aegis]|uniref:uncharacterized protein LOC121383052 n=1 Tax=Gigantopelta aegis TaxID=1735272 RepID=UPI001B88E361|nr:uncharacterized protein LOC121383052 [Gigantopelta aegis]
MHLSTRALSALAAFCLCAGVTQVFGHGNPKPCPVCSEILANIANGSRPQLSYECNCVVKDLKMTMAQLRTTISNLEGQLADVTGQLNTTQAQLNATNQQLQAICPDSTDLRAACDADSDFTFLESGDGCQAICYNVSTAKVNYAGAEAACAAAGGALITLDTMKKNALMIDAIRTSNRDDSFWIGLKFVTGNWVWQGTGNQMTFSDWANTEPDNNQDCASLNKLLAMRIQT